MAPPPLGLNYKFVFTQTQIFERQYFSQKSVSAKGAFINRALLLTPGDVVRMAEIVHQNQVYDVKGPFLRSDLFWEDLRSTLKLFKEQENAKIAVNCLQNILFSLQDAVSKKSEPQAQHLLGE